MVANGDSTERLSRIRASLSALLRRFGGWTEAQASSDQLMLDYHGKGLVFLRVGIVDPGGELFLQFGEIGRDSSPLGFPLELGDLISIGRQIRRGFTGESEGEWLCAVLRTAAHDVLSCDTRVFAEMRAKRLSLISAEKMTESDRQIRERLAHAWAVKDYKSVVELVRQLGERAVESERIKGHFASEKLA